MDPLDKLLKGNTFVALKEYAKECECGYGYMVKEIGSMGDTYYCINCDKSYFVNNYKKSIQKENKPPQPISKKEEPYEGYLKDKTEFYNKNTNNYLTDKDNSYSFEGYKEAFTIKPKRSKKRALLSFKLSC